jgi:hypothetical protein
MRLELVDECPTDSMSTSLLRYEEVYEMYHFSLHLIRVESIMIECISDYLIIYRGYISGK